MSLLLIIDVVRGLSLKCRFVDDARVLCLMVSKSDILINTEDKVVRTWITKKRVLSDLMIHTEIPSVQFSVILKKINYYDFCKFLIFKLSVFLSLACMHLVSDLRRQITVIFVRCRSILSQPWWPIGASVKPIPVACACTLDMLNKKVVSF